MLALLWGLSGESPLEAVQRELASIGTPVLFINQREVLDTEIYLRVDESVTGEVRVRDQRADLSEVSAAYVRPYSSHLIPAVARKRPESAARRHALSVESAMWAWAEIAPTLVINRPGASDSNGSKPYQAELIRAVGFRMPKTLLTTDPDAARGFWEKHGEVVYKSVSGNRSIVSRLRPEHARRLADVRHCPTQFQEYVRGIDVRVHVVGEEVFACEVLSDADDYRYPGERVVELRSCVLPEDVEEKCVLVSKALCLHVTGIDLRRTPEGEWFCFEANPSPAFTYYETRAGLLIGRAIARLLASGTGWLETTGPSKKILNT